MTVDTLPKQVPLPGPDDIQPVDHETRDRIITGTITVVPFLALGRRRLAGLEQTCCTGTTSRSS